jgi:hypothetical protein
LIPPVESGSQLLGVKAYNDDCDGQNKQDEVAPARMEVRRSTALRVMMLPTAIRSQTLVTPSCAAQRLPTTLWEVPTTWMLMAPVALIA